MDFDALLERFTTAVTMHDGAALAALFTDDGVYDDDFFGPHRGPAAIAAMLDRFYEGGEQYHWDFFDALSDAAGGYVRYRFSLVSKVPESAGEVIVFEGISRFVFEGPRIARYGEVFDRGMALAELRFDPVRLAKIMARYGDALHASPAFARHLER